MTRALTPAMQGLEWLLCRTLWFPPAAVAVGLALVVLQGAASVTALATKEPPR